jgi:hypothetical protein
MSIAATLAAAQTSPAPRPCIVGRYLTDLPERHRDAILEAIQPGNINTIRRVCAQDRDHPYTGSHAPWHKHFTADCSCHRTT